MYGPQTTDRSYGISAVDPTRFGVQLRPTPGEGNEGPCVEEPVQASFDFEPAPGILKRPTVVRARLAASNVPLTTRVTFDGSVPTPASPVLPGEIEITRDLVVRAAGFLDGVRATEVHTATYLFDVDVPTSLPRLAVALDPADFRVIQLNQAGRGRASEREAYLEVFDQTPGRAYATSAGFRLHGGYGRRGSFSTKKS